MEFPASESIYPVEPKTSHLYPPPPEIESQHLHVGKSVVEGAKFNYINGVCVFQIKLKLDPQTKIVNSVCVCVCVQLHNGLDKERLKWKQMNITKL